MICRPHNQPHGRPGHRRDGLLVQRAPPLRPGAQVRDQAHDAQRAARWCKDLQYRLDVNTLHRDESADVARRSTRSAGSRCARTQPLFFDEYRRNRDTGSFILIDEATNDTVAAGMIL